MNSEFWLILIGGFALLYLISLLASGNKTPPANAITHMPRKISNPKKPIQISPDLRLQLTAEVANGTPNNEKLIKLNKKRRKSNDASFPKNNERKNKRLPSIELKYINTRDVVQKRVVQPYRVRANIDYFEAYCNLEETVRSFRFDRIHYATNVITGEILSQIDLYLLIHPKRKPPPRLEEMPIYALPLDQISKEPKENEVYSAIDL